MVHNTFETQTKREMISRTFHLDSRQLEPLKRVSRELGISQSEMIRRSVELFIEEFKKHTKKAR